MSRPGCLIIVTNGNEADLWSAHYTESDADIMLERLEAILSASGGRAHKIVVPDVEGVVKATRPFTSPATAPAPPSPPQAALPQPDQPKKFKRITQSEFEAETAAMMMSDDGARDADASLSEGGAFG